MAETATIARPYAEALFRVASESSAGNLGAWSELVSEMGQVAANPDMKAVAGDPNVPGDKLAELFLSVLKSPLNDEARRFVKLLVDNGRLTVMPEIAEQFHVLKNAREGSSDVEITSAFPLEGSQLNDLVAALERKFGRKLYAQVAVDPSLIGGVSVKVGDEVLDTSVRSRLAAMQATLTA
ncbi:F0F1 ATP synthase subunit delta [Cupriavidus necator]|uniref:ATP synthase subunit delta n=2 Tax=Cupriavidus necator (strain ATCC 17699 / DSM 428 / KCTC 22496 / NCIMB 10442 / H16 / Stanier 337) TaxID=381666 RepID=ATPD_CUPNH|nr:MULTISPECIES: F0F1 ATP synthase subunit delta [Cupriavidus]Q0K5M4.1 RecName: Full=ATP synthase subunit delta; AltName: Full=ATP synthase F(1) sector subunit delta; AltName: Full=F-type ATPase subunit delta; Short=F-ATPase subunit delta [Cupriavidus necator H16]EON19260.1 F0F1 ATP synthase subunit delta [Cupriavidus sp. GA3-3]KUE86634.1 ATP synthase F0F1 subunit delta [Cupriavidus necator]QCC02437.1 F0F1 ATP synthase subunit delta [Cupriavidus necator H16]QQB78156.1 F0F1 ATP synthase subunit